MKQHEKKIIELAQSLSGCGVHSTSVELGDLGLDSLDMIEFAQFVEDEFNISVTDDDIAQWNTLDDILTTVCKELLVDKK